jgi:hypothetical protein
MHLLLLGFVYVLVVVGMLPHSNCCLWIILREKWLNFNCGAFITNLACDELIMKLCEVHSFISSYILYKNIMHWKHVRHIDKCVYEWQMNFTWILHLLINMCVKCVFNAQYQCVKCTNYEWMNFAWFPLLNNEMLSLRWLL